jgi:hypothetical protein
MKIKKSHAILIVLIVLSGVLFIQYLVGRETTDVECDSYSVEECGGGCVVCPPCQECSSLSCQTEEFCKGIGFNRDWYEGVKETRDVKLFTEKIHALLLERIGQPIEGYDAHMLIQGLPGLLPYDFHGVKTLEGRYQIEDEQLVFKRTQGSPISSAERMITTEGYEALLQHLKGRFMTEDVNLIIERISVEPDNPFCNESGVLAVSECDGFSSVVYEDTDKSSGYYRNDGSRIICTSGVEDPECEDIQRIMISSMTVCIQVC